MLGLVIIVLLIVSIAISKSKPLLAGILDLLVALLILFGRVFPGTADLFDWIIMMALLAGAIVFFIQSRKEKPQTSM